MSVLVSDPDFVLHVGDVREELAAMPDGSVDCVITSPPYWGLRDYGTGVWGGGNPDCDHLAPPTGGPNSGRYTPGGREMFRAANDKPYSGVCGKCGAQRQDQQLGLEPTPDAYIANMVAVFREVHRVLADHGTCWLNIGDSYAGGGYSNHENTGGEQRENGGKQQHTRTTALGLKPKDLVGIPWKLAFALQADGWYLRADIIWAKPNPMPESVTDRPTKSHEYVFLLSKRPRYWFDQEAVREPHISDGRGVFSNKETAKWARGTMGNGAPLTSMVDAQVNPAGRNVRSVWEIATQPYAEAHFATYPEELVRRCLLAGCPERVCVSCGRPSERIVEVPQNGKPDPNAAKAHGGIGNNLGGGRHQAWRAENPARTVGWSDCGHNTWRPGTILDPFLGSGTTALVARKHGRRCVGIELNPEYAELAVRRNAQQTIWTTA